MWKDSSTTRGRRALSCLIGLAALGTSFATGTGSDRLGSLGCRITLGVTILRLPSGSCGNLSLDSRSHAGLGSLGRALRPPA